MRTLVTAVVAVGLLAAPSLGVVNIKVTADGPVVDGKVQLDCGATTTVRIWGQGTAAGLFQLGGDVKAGVSDPTLLSANAGTMVFSALYNPSGLFTPKPGIVGTNGGWSNIGTVQTSWDTPNPDLGRTDYIEVCHYTVTAAATGAGPVTLTFAGKSVSGYKPLECDKTGTLGANVAVAIQVGDELQVAPAGAFPSSGYAGGPFSPSSMTYTLTNTSDLPLSWTAGKTQNWVTLDNTSGTLAGGASTAVVVSINSNANSLSASGTPYADTVSFTNMTNHVGDTTRPVSLTVNSAPLQITPADGLVCSGWRGGPFSPSSKTYTLTSTLPLSWTAGKTQAWITLDNLGGTLTGGDSATVTVSINSVADSLPPGTYSDTVTFTNTTNGLGDTTRSVSLTIPIPTGDVNRDGHVDVGDLLYLVDAWGAREPSSNWNAACDLNGDGHIDSADFAVFQAANGSYSGQPNWNAACDLNGDGVINDLDRHIFTMAFGTHPGQANYNAACDFNGDGNIDIADFNILQAATGSHQGQPNWNAACDFNGDGHIDSADLAILQAANGAYAGDPNWNAACDFNNDGWVDVIDLLIFVGNFGT